MKEYSYKISRGLLAALRHFGTFRHSITAPSVFIYGDDSGFETAWTLEAACSNAYDILAAEQLDRLKLLRLKVGMRNLGLESAYNYIMGEKL